MQKQWRSEWLIEWYIDLSRVSGLKEFIYGLQNTRNEAPIEPTVAIAVWSCSMM
jgi:hypothetical protein